MKYTQKFKLMFYMIILIPGRSRVFAAAANRCGR